MGHMDMRCTWCHAVLPRSRLKRVITSIVGRPRVEWSESGVKVIYTCCSCYEHRRKLRPLCLKFEMLRLQYGEFDRFGVKYYFDHADRVVSRVTMWKELKRAYYLASSFSGMKFSPILSIDGLRGIELPRLSDGMEELERLEVAEALTELGGHALVSPIRGAGHKRDRS